MRKWGRIIVCVVVALVLLISVVATGVLGVTRIKRKTFPMEPGEVIEQVPALEFRAEELDAAAYMFQLPVVREALEKGQDAELEWEAVEASLSHLCPDWAIHADVLISGQTVWLDFRASRDRLILEYIDLDGDGTDLLRKTFNGDGDAVGSTSYSGEYDLSAGTVQYQKTVAKRLWLPILNPG